MAERRITSAGGIARDSTSFFGRADDLRAITNALEGGSPLVTVLGPAGVGKTRVVCEWAAAVRQGATFCDLAAAGSAADVIETVGRAAGVPLGGSGVATQIGKAFALRGSSVIILDNVDHVLEELRTLLVTTWFRLAPNVRFLVTSRTPLGIREEVRCELTPLEGQAAVALFASRAASVRPGFELTATLAPVVFAIVQRLDRLPLAIELAACRASVHDPQTLLERLSERRESLETTLSTLDARHLTLDEAIRWSWELLDPTERSVLRACAAFRGSFSVGACEVVLGVEYDGRKTNDIVRTLRERSFLSRSDPDPRGEVRFVLLRSIRDFVERWSTEPAELAARHATYFLERYEAACDAFGDVDSEAMLRTMVFDCEELHAVFRFAAGDPPLLVRAALALDAVLELTGPYPKHVAVLDEGVAAATGLLRARLLVARSRCHRLGGRVDAALADAAQAAELARPAADVATLGRAVECEGVARLYAGHYEAAATILREATDLARRAGDSKTLAFALNALGWVLGDREMMHEALARARRLQNRRLEASVLGSLGVLDTECGRSVRALACGVQAMALLHELGDPRTQAAATLHLAWVFHVNGLTDQAAAAFDDAHRRAQAVGDQRYEAFAIIGRATVSLEQGRLPEAEMALRALLAELPEPSLPWVESSAHAVLSAVLAAEGAVTEAKRALSRSLRLGAGLGGPTFAAYLRATEGLVAVGLAREAASRPSPDDEVVEQYRRDARAALADASAHPNGSERRSLELRAILTSLESIALGERAAKRSQPIRRITSKTRVTLADDGSWFALFGKRIELGNRRALRRIVVLLAGAVRRMPGQAVSVEELVDVAWEGERLTPRSARNRLHNAMATLRRLGFAEIILTRPEGYLFDPRIQFETNEPAHDQV